MSKEQYTNDALTYHSEPKPGIIEVKPSKINKTELAMSLASSTGAVESCLEIVQKAENVYKYSTKGNLLAIITNGTSVLGLGNIGPLASKPAMEGNVVLLKTYADIDAFDIELDTTDIDVFVKTVKALAPTFGAIDLVDIKAPECFEIENRLNDILEIPVMHDNHHGIAIVSAAALLNACEIAQKKISEIKIIIYSADPAAIACANMYSLLGVRQGNIIMFDNNGIISSDRTDLDKYKKEFAIATSFKTMVDSLKDADAFVDFSKDGKLTKDMLSGMSKNPIVFLLTNTNPEITIDIARSIRNDIILASGRNNLPNQLIKDLCYPYIFRGALDVRAKKINNEMKLAAVHALAGLAKEPEVFAIFTNEAFHFEFNRDYFIPKPFDNRLGFVVATAVAKAAVKSGVARVNIENWQDYTHKLFCRIVI
jgi:malate dehydrogenase (oxaloacetate-decarboxylating)(NADP+)